MAGSHPFAGIFIFLAFSALVLPKAVVLCEFPATLTLSRAFPANQRVEELSQLRARDMLRHGRILQSSGRIAEFSLLGTYSPFLVGLYYTKVQLGSPPKEFHVQIDTGSDALWVNCNACNSCPISSGLKIPINSFNPSSSSTASVISCFDKRCALGAQSSDAGCSKKKDRCNYSFQFGDGSGTLGYYVSDELHFNTVAGNSSTSNSSTSILFG
ncbi:aspartic proteinase 36-like [Cornus florida]|uniref:aspartic proteinase 36-like n=1 Tax=Cornus florida TaxID=4283 RepID=UPI00289FC98E|nr:aspartic proteinase 36-like [Cornus florida]